MEGCLNFFMDFLVADFVLETLSPNLLVFPKVMKPEASNVIVIIIKVGSIIFLLCKIGTIYSLYFYSFK